MPIVTAYASLGPKGLRTALSETQAKAIFLDPEQFAVLSLALASASPSESTSEPTSASESEALELEIVIYHGIPDSDILAEFKRRHRGITVVEYDILLKLGRQESSPVDGVEGDEEVRPGKDDIACVMYTSGSAGKPKGVLLSHGNVLSAGTPIPRPSSPPFILPTPPSPVLYPLTPAL